MLETPEVLDSDAIHAKHDADILTDGSGRTIDAFAANGTMMPSRHPRNRDQVSACRAGAMLRLRQWQLACERVVAHGALRAASPAMHSRSRFREGTQRTAHPAGPPSAVGHHGPSRNRCAAW